MHTALVFLVCGLVAIVLCAPQQEKFLEMKKICIDESGATDEMVMNTFTGTFSSDPALPKYLVCIGKRAGFLDADGHVHKDILKKQLLMFTDDEAAVDTVVDKCLIEKATLEESAIASAQCMFTELHK